MKAILLLISAMLACLIFVVLQSEKREEEQSVQSGAKSSLPVFKEEEASPVIVPKPKADLPFGGFYRSKIYLLIDVQQ